MRGIDGVQYRVPNTKFLNGDRTVRLERHPGIATVHAIIDLDRLEPDIAPGVAGAEAHMVLEITRQRGSGGLELAPRDLPIAIGVHPHRELDIAYRESHSAGE